jgi:hypothetical protein
LAHARFLLRPPYGSITPRQKHLIHDDLGYEIILWDVDPLDWKEPGPNIVSSRILKETRPGSIVLSHDIHAQTIQAMPATLNRARSQGIQIRYRLRIVEATNAGPAADAKPVNAPTALPRRLSPLRRTVNARGMIADHYLQLRTDLETALIRLLRLGADLQRNPGSLETLHALLIDIRQPLLFVVVGEVKAGKSSLLNALFGREFAKTGVLPATDRVCIFRYGEVEKTVDVSPN